MNYELAKQLKDAGFPQEGDGGMVCECFELKDSPKGTVEVLGYDHKRAYEPTLSELIEACVEGGFRSLRWIMNEKVWTAFAFRNGDILSSGKTPEEAVARLYIELNGSSK